MVELKVTLRFGLAGIGRGAEPEDGLVVGRRGEVSFVDAMAVWCAYNEAANRWWWI